MKREWRLNLFNDFDIYQFTYITLIAEVLTHYLSHRTQLGGPTLSFLAF